MLNSVLASLLFLVSPFSVPDQSASKAPEQPTEYIVKYKDHVPSSRQKGEVERMEDLNMAVVGSDSKSEAKRLAKSLKRRQDVEYVEPSVQRNISGPAVTNDSLSAQQWYMPYLDMPSLWKEGPSRKDVTVAVIDSGIDLNHPELHGRIASGGYNFLADSANVQDEQGHGTAVGGLIAALSNNGRGISGVTGSFPVQILPLKVIGNDGKGSSADVIRAIYYAMEKHVDVINMSLGSGTYSAAEKEAVGAALGQGITVIASSGNESSPDYYYPASYDGVISVGSINEQGEVSAFSNHNDRVDLTAPGEGIVTLGINNGYVKASGTSFSAPIVAGVASVLKSMHPEAGEADIASWLRRMSHDEGLPGHDSYYGYGVVEPIGASRALDTKLWPIKEAVSENKAWKITFSLPVDTSRLSGKDIIVFDAYGKATDITVEQAGTNAIRILPPASGYRRGEAYEIYVKNELRSRSGIALDQGLRIPFRVGS